MDDVLEVTDDCNLPKLRDLYKDRGSDTDHIYNYLCTVIKWKTLHPDSKYFTILVPREDQSTGTFIGINRYHCNELFIGSLEESGETLYRALTETKQIDWSEYWIIYALYGKLYCTVLKALKNATFEYAESGSANIWHAPKEKAIGFKINCPDEVYIAKLEPDHAKIINPVWPPRYKNSEPYLATLIRMNGGYGVFLKSNDQLVAWAIRNNIGLGAIQTLKDYSKKGYGSLISKYLAKKIAEDGYNPLGTVRKGNIPSERMFTKMGFEVAGSAYYILNKLMQLSENSARS